MSERLSAKQYDGLVESVWALVKVALARPIEIAPPPCLVRGEIRTGDQHVELSVDVTKPNQQIETAPPRMLQIAVGDLEPYGPDEEFLFWPYEMLTLYPSKRGREYTKGHEIFPIEGGSLLLPDTKGLPAGARRRLGTLAWRDLKSNITFGELGPVEAERFRKVAEELALNSRDV